MKKKLFLTLSVIFTMFFAFGSGVQAYIDSEQAIDNKVMQLKELHEFDFLSIVNKGELIGYRLNDFQMQSRAYANTILVAIDNLKNINQQIQLIQKSQELSFSDKEMRIRKLYQDADMALYDVDTKTSNYLIDLRNIMPTLTYDRYLRSFQDYYNSLDLTSSDLYVYR